MQRQLTTPVTDQNVIDYDEMCQAIAQVYEIDEAKLIMDKAAALEEFARRALNTDNERLCAEIRLRAERKAGQLIKEMPKDKGGQPSKKNPSLATRGSKTLEEYGVSYDQSSQWQKLATIEDKFFEAELAGTVRPASTAGILKGWNKVLREKKREEREARKLAKAESAGAPAEASTEPEEEQDELAEFFRNVSLDQWKTLTTKQHKRLLTLDLTSGEVGRFNSQTSDAIEWAQWSWNPVTGCMHTCPYCYARDIANSGRMVNAYPNGFAPTLRPASLLVPRFMAVPDEAKDDTRYRNVFTCSMADLFGRWVPRDWIEAVLAEMRAAPQWNFLCLTKFPKRMAEFDIPENCWMGTTVDLQSRVAAAEAAFVNVKAKVRWLSIEPLIEPIKFSSLENFDWMVVGGSSRASQTPEWIPPIRWVIDLYNDAQAAGVKFYMKTNMGVEKRILELPFDALIPSEEDPAPSVFDYLGGRKA